MGNRVLGIQILKRVMHLKVAELSPRRAMEVGCSALDRTVLSVVVLTVESADMAYCGCDKSGHMVNYCRYKKEVKMEVMLILGLIHRMQKQSSLLRGICSTPLRAGRSTRSRLMWSQVCCKYSQLLFMLYLIQGLLFPL